YTEKPKGMIKDINPLKKLTSLRKLHLSDNEIRDISTLGNLEQLEELYLGNNQIDDIPTSFQNLKKLKTLYLTENKLTNIEPLEGVIGLEVLDLEKNDIQDFSALEALRSPEQVNTIKTSGNLTDLSYLTNRESEQNLENAFPDG